LPFARGDSELTKRENLVNDSDPDRAQHAALLVSKVYFYIGYYDEAVTFALQAGGRFEDEPSGEYKETIIGELLPFPPRRKDAKQQADSAAGCLDRAITMTNRGEKVEGGLHAVVDGVMRSSTGDNGKLVS
jgi:26S proteasome regulatory subunit N2